MWFINRIQSYFSAQNFRIKNLTAGVDDTDAVNVSQLNTSTGAMIPLSQKGAASGVAPLNASSKIDSAYLPSYVDDVLEFANLASFPVSGETDKIYIAIDSGKIYRWSGSAYIQITNGLIASTADVPDSTNKRYVTDVDLTKLGNTSGTNTGDETTASIKTKLGAASASADGYLTSSDWATFNGKLASGEDYSTASGTDTYSATLSPTRNSISTGQTITIKFTNANTGAATLTLGSGSAVSIRKGVAGIALVSGDIRAGGVYRLFFDGTYYLIIAYIGTLRSMHLQDVGSIYTGGPISPSVSGGRIQNDVAGPGASATIHMEISIPPDFISFFTNCVSIDTRRQTSGASASVTFNKNGVNDSVISSLSVSPTTTNNTWETKTTTPGSAYVPGDPLLLTINMATGSSLGSSIGVSRLRIYYLGQ